MLKLLRLCSIRKVLHSFQVNMRQNITACVTWAQKCLYLHRHGRLCECRHVDDCFSSGLNKKMWSRWNWVRKQRGILTCGEACSFQRFVGSLFLSKVRSWWLFKPSERDFKMAAGFRDQAVVFVKRFSPFSLCGSWEQTDQKDDPVQNHG